MIIMSINMENFALQMTMPPDDLDDERENKLNLDDIPTSLSDPWKAIATAIIDIELYAIKYERKLESLHPWEPFSNCDTIYELREQTDIIRDSVVKLVRLATDGLDEDEAEFVKFPTMKVVPIMTEMAAIDVATNCIDKMAEWIPEIEECTKLIWGNAQIIANIATTAILGK